jgi:hypothetical protein
MDFFHGSLWNTILQLLRDPIFALVFSVVLTILASRAVRRVIKTILYLGAIGLFIWLVTHNRAFADLCLAVIGAVFHILLTVIIVLAVICVVVIICVLIMFVITKPAPRSLRKSSAPWNILSFSSKKANEAEELYTPLNNAELLAALATGHIDDEQARTFLTDKQHSVMALAEEGQSIFEELTEDFNKQNGFMVIVNCLHLYFSGLTPYMKRIKKIHKACNALMIDLASILPVIFPNTDVKILEDMARAKVFLPDSNEWHNLMDEADVEGARVLLMFILLRLLCLHRDWREVATIAYKGYCYIKLLEQCLDAL